MCNAENKLECIDSYLNSSNRDIYKRKTLYHFYKVKRFCKVSYRLVIPLYHVLFLIVTF